MSNKTARLYVRVEPAWLAQVEDAAKRLGLDLSAYVVLSVSERMRRDAKDEPAPKKKR
jgi:hypothetical protein